MSLGKVLKARWYFWPLYKDSRAQRKNIKGFLSFMIKIGEDKLRPPKAGDG